MHSQPHSASLETLRQRDFHGIDGKFHSHITVHVSGDDEIERLRMFCRERRVKLTVIDLENFRGRAQRDVMTTQHYRVEGSGAVREIIESLRELTRELGEEGFEVVRVKLEHESLPTLPVFDGSNYREIHVKLRVDPARFDEELAWLREVSGRWGFVPSSNPRAIHGDHIVQFVNLRLYEGTLEETEAVVADLVSALVARGLDVAEVKQETAVFDTNLDLDRWWA